MRISQFESNEAMSEAALKLLLDVVGGKPDALICTATGSSPTGLYQGMASYERSHPHFFGKIRVIQLDEWIGLGVDEEGSCGHYLNQHLVQPLGVSNDRYYAFDGLATNPKEECQNMQETLDQQGPIDICILGVGKNGHLGLNEPADELQDHCNVASLQSVTRKHGMVQSSRILPTQGMTLGMQDILSSRYILLLVAGSGKEEALRQLERGSVSNHWPVTHLLNHDNTDCLVAI